MVAEANSPKVLVIGLDAGCGRLIRKWAGTGHLPAMEALISDGTWKWLKTTAESLHVSAWPSIYTGTLPGKHGVYYTLQPAPGLQGYRRFGRDQYGQPTFWRILSGAGRKCTVMDATYTHPEKGFQGIQVYEWGTWAWYWKPMSRPAGIMRKLRRHCGEYPLGLEAHRLGLAAFDPVELRDRLVRAAAAKTEAVLWLMDQAPWELFLTVFCETHPAAHYCWPADGVSDGIDPSGPAIEPLRDVYQAVDRGIGRILERVGRETTVFIISGDGVGSNESGWHLLPEVLRRLGFFAGPGSAGPENHGQNENGEGEGSGSLLKRVKNLVPADFRKSVAECLPNGIRDAINRRMDAAGVDWSKTRAYCLPTDLEGCIRINLKGREPQGAVAPGEEYRRVCGELTEALLQLTNPSTGRPAVHKVVQTEEIFPGDRRHYLPDLVVLWSEGTEISALRSEKIGTVSGPSPDARTGTHRPPGFVILRGPSISGGRLGEEGHITDLAPTVLEQLGVVPPATMDGKPWK